MDARDWDERYGATDLVWSADPNRFVVEETADLQPGRALDLAAGEGRNAIWLAEQGWQVTAVDFSPVGVDKGRRLADAAGVEVAWLVADATTWEPPAQGFDLVLVAYLQVPPDGRRAAHRRAAEAVARGGTLLIVGHDRDNLELGYGGPPDPEVLLDVDGVVGDLEGTGLTIVAAGQVERTVDTDEGTRTAIDCLVRATRPR
ncbi:MAG TPA: class I SAM-dependent methyltransferase [Egicoccus sp.]|nr:class I SAM-dependent methyltransferase [Egicoccus sp.]HSK24997.1 class I SAM-dependent methyltransferase [Egicoccus sp.]